MYRKIFLNIVIMLFFTATADSQQLTPQRIVPQEWIKSWLICGPIPLQEQKDPSCSMIILMDSKLTTS